MPHRRAARYILGHVGVASAATAAVLAFTVLFFSLRWRAQDLDRSANEARQTHTALCAFRHDLEQRYGQTKKILDEHPNEDPVKAFGLTIPRAQLEANALAQRRTLKSLDVLKCEP